MAKRRKQGAKPAAPLVPPLGPPVNLRPAGPHADKRRLSRSKAKAALLKAAFDTPPAPVIPSPQLAEEFARR